MRRHRRSTPSLVAVILLLSSALIGITGVGTAGAEPPDGATVTYAATQVIPPPPAPEFSGSGGGDGYDLAFWNGNVYNVYHHQENFTIQCHETMTADVCDGYPKTVVDTSDSSPLTTSDLSTIFIDQTTGILYSFTSRLDDERPGMVTVDLSSANANPFRSFIPLGGAGEARPGHVQTTGQVIFGTKMYAFNLVPNVAGPFTGAANKFVCFDRATETPCSGQPYALPDAPAEFNNGWSGPASLTQFGTRLMIGLSDAAYTSAPGSIYCFDVAINGDCGGAWPISTTEGVSLMASGVPVLDANGVQTGVCFLLYDPTYSGNWVDPWCTDRDGTHLPAPSAALGSEVTGTHSNPYNGPPVVIGTRVWVPLGDEWGAGLGSQVRCFDWSTGTACPNFPLSWPDSVVSYMYTVTSMPGNPSCLWINADSGSGQISNFDAYTAGPCGEGGTRILMNSFVQPDPSCRPTKYLSMSISSPLPSAYSNGTVTFQDSNGAPIAGVPTLPIVDGMVDLAPLDIATTSGLPQMLVDLPGASTESMTMRIAWEGAYHGECVLGGQSVEYDPSPVTPAFTG